MLMGYMVSGALVAALAVVWAVRSRQFEDQDRARFLPLRDLGERELASPPRAHLPPSVVWMGVVLLVGLGTLARLVLKVAGLE
jgi:cbb3-type cytochrome oxidase maturation protein